ncbi:MAG: FKBP-type peptidyl-prolyl cis-trans isomerase [Gammaproteobacteria bacterium]|nr:FKBP-type peptidyl-prolyl cis-trans isomerase [Gammaproteobacteria bacterium]
MTPKPLALALMALAWTVAVHAKDEAPALKTEQDRLSYGIGVQTARNFKKDQVEINVEAMVRGLRDGMSGERIAISEAELKDIMNKFMAELVRKSRVTRQLAAQENAKKADTFLAANKSREGVKALSNGVQYKVVKAGAGRKPTKDDTIVCRFRGTTAAGMEFVGTQGDQTATVKMTGITPEGVRDAVAEMPLGSKWQLVIPPKLGFGERGVGGDIAPNEVLIYDFELVEIK